MVEKLLYCKHKVRCKIHKMHLHTTEYTQNTSFIQPHRLLLVIFDMFLSVHSASGLAVSRAFAMVTCVYKQDLWLANHTYKYRGRIKNQTLYSRSRDTPWALLSITSVNSHVWYYRSRLPHCSSL